MKAPVVALKQPGITARTPDQFARKSVHNGRNPANTITSHSPKVTADQGLGRSSRKTDSTSAKDQRKKLACLLARGTRLVQRASVSSSVSATPWFIIQKVAAD